MNNHNDPFLISKKACKANAQFALTKSFSIYAWSSVPLIILGIIYFLIRISDVTGILYLITLLLIDILMPLLLVNLECIGIIKSSKHAFPIFRNKKLLLNELGLVIVLDIICNIGYVLLIVPGVIFYLATSQAELIYFDSWQHGHKIPLLQAISNSNALMCNHKLDFFILQLSFIGWGIIILFTIGVAGIWIYPYMTQTYANYYLALNHRPMNQGHTLNLSVNNSENAQKKYKGTVFGTNYRNDSDSF